ncbi:hypothetical protein CU254_02045 [Amycolatopsis sp. AA4]|nr:hypothetical protein CU254_02045 [Amycolatopsis sp. AA4]
MALGASDAPNATLGASHAPNATLGRKPHPPTTATGAPNDRGTQPLPHTPIRSLPAVWGCLSRHLSRLDKHPQTVSTIKLRGAPRKTHGKVARQGDEPKQNGPARKTRTDPFLNRSQIS